MWFEQLTGFKEHYPEQVRACLTLSGTRITSKLNGKSYECGTLDMPSLAELRAEVAANAGVGTPAHASGEPALTLHEIVGNVADLHAHAHNRDALFQVASQFNLLEMVSPEVTPERGVQIYQYDRTQGPACAIAAGAGTIFRNYFAAVKTQPGAAPLIGQTAEHQLDGLADLGAALGNVDARLWRMQNGYALATKLGLDDINSHLAGLTEDKRDALRALVRVGVQWQTQVTLDSVVDAQPAQLVSQIYCSALPVAYSMHPSALWQPFACLVLEAAYEATLCAAILNSIKTGSRRLYLTLLGGGAFGNQTGWIVAALLRALRLHRDAKLAVYIVSYGGSKAFVQDLIAQYQPAQQQNY
jgi:hypothetical protein